MTTRIAFVDHTGVISGGEVALCNLLGAIDRRRWEPRVILGQDGALRERIESLNVPVSLLTTPPILSAIRQGDLTVQAQIHPYRILSSLWYAIRLARQVRADRIRLIHANTLRACVLAGLAGRMTGIPTVWQIHSVIRSPLMAPSGLRLVQRLARHLPAHILCNSRQTAADFDVPKDRMSVIPCGVDGVRFSPNGRTPGQRPRIGMVARFSPIKGQHIFVKAAGLLAGRYPQAEFILAGTPLFGESEYVDQVKLAARDLPNHNAIQFLGFVDDVAGLLHTLDVVVNPSIHPEGLGQVIIEAMMTAKPVIASASGGPIDVIEDGQTGLLVPPADPQALADAVDGILSQPALALAMGRRARQSAIERFDIRATARAVERVYSQVLSA